MHPFTQHFLNEISKRDVFQPISNQIEALSAEQTTAKRKALDNKVDEASDFLSTLDNTGASKPDERELAHLRTIAGAARDLMYCAHHFQDILWDNKEASTKKDSPRSFDKMGDPKEHIEVLKPFLNEPFEKDFREIAAQLICAFHNMHALALAYKKNFKEAESSLNEGLTFCVQYPAMKSTLTNNLDRIKLEATLCRAPSETLTLISYSARLVERARASSSPSPCEDLVHGIAHMDIGRRRASFVK